MNADWKDEYIRGEVDACHLCGEIPAVTSDGVCSDCAKKHPLVGSSPPPAITTATTITT